MDIVFLGYHADDRFLEAYRNRAEPLELEKFYSAVNQGKTAGCSCCKREVAIYAVVASLPQVEASTLSLCVDCIRTLPDKLEILNLGSGGIAPRLCIKDDVIGIGYDNQ